MRPYLIVAWDFVRTGGMDVANFALARHLALRGHEVHLLAHSICDELRSLPGIVPHVVPKLAQSYFLSTPLFDRMGRTLAARLSARGGRVVVNGGNCRFGDVNWVHYVHAAYKPVVNGGPLRRLRWRCTNRVFRGQERAALSIARVVIANSDMTRRDLVDRLAIPDERVHTIYYGIDSEQFRPRQPEERASIRRELGWAEDRRIVAFVGALSDRRKGFDTVLEAWRRLCSMPEWDADLVVIGSGSEAPAWQSRAAEAGLAGRIRFLGFRSDVPRVLGAADALAAPTRYEAFGLGVQEALCCGLPAFVTRTAGVAERYPAHLRELLLDDPGDAVELAGKLRAWRPQAGHYSAAVRELAAAMRQHTWDRMSAQIVELVEESKR